MASDRLPYLCAAGCHHSSAHHLAHEETIYHGTPLAGYACFYSCPLHGDDNRSRKPRACSPSAHAFPPYHPKHLFGGMILILRRIGMILQYVHVSCLASCAPHRGECKVTLAHMKTRKDNMYSCFSYTKHKERHGHRRRPKVIACPPCAAVKLASCLEPPSTLLPIPSVSPACSFFFLPAMRTNGVAVQQSHQGARNM